MLEILESWLALMQHCPRHFRLSQGALEGMAAYALPAAGRFVGIESTMPPACMYTGDVLTSACSLRPPGCSLCCPRGLRLRRTSALMGVHVLC